MKKNVKFCKTGTQGPVNTVVKGVNTYTQSMGELSLEGREMQYHVHIDLADILRAMFEGVRQCQEGSQKSYPQCNVTPQLQYPVQGGVAPCPGSYIGIYNYRSYGVFDDANRLASSLKYVPGNIQGIFDTYEEAFTFAQEGIAELSGLPIEEVPALQHALNWIQRIGGECDE